MGATSAIMSIILKSPQWTPKYATIYEVIQRLKKVLQVPGVWETTLAILHVIMLEVAESDWESTLEAKMQGNELARYSRVGEEEKKPTAVRYYIDSQDNLMSTEIEPSADTINLCYSDIQWLELIRDELSAASAIIHS
ncbi:hypothetical protein CHU98_g9353 [Xylaria longipes]|nr:hypothetical protein CHU98_g9353 [Xylaria longipes]